MLILRICCALLLLPVIAGAQARLVLNGAKINIANGAQLVVDNPAADALTRYDGHIISEGERNVVKWNIGNTTGTYTVPLGYGAAGYLPLRFTKDVGAGSGSFLFATYHTTWRNSDLMPAGVTNVTFNGSDYSPFIIDRFWKMSTSNYTAKPSLTDLSFTYAESEAASPNTITEGNLEARRWNSTAQTWTDYRSAATVNTATNTVTLAAMPAAQWQDWWLLVDNVYVLPVQWLQFTAAAEGAAARLNWKTSGENAGAVFTLERSPDAVQFTFVAHVPGTINSRTARPYTYLDKEALRGRSYYRLKETDADGAVSYSPVRSVFIKSNDALFTVYPNPVTSRRCTINLYSNTLQNVRLELISMSGSLVWSQAVPDGQQLSLLQLPGSFAAGVYTLKISTAQGIMQQNLVVR